MNTNVSRLIRFRWTGALSAGALLLSLGIAGCGESDSDTAEPSAESSAQSDDQPTTVSQAVEHDEDVLEAYIGANNYLELDKLTDTDSNPADANLFANDGTSCSFPGGVSGLLGTLGPEDSCSRLFPSTTNSDAAWIDWHTLGADTGPDAEFDLAEHRVPDVQNDQFWSGSGTDSCITTTGNAPDKGDFGYVGYAANNEFAYFNANRLTNTGNTDIFGAFLREDVQVLTQSEAQTAGVPFPCKPNEELVLSTVCPGDVLLKSFFPSTSAATVDIVLYEGQDADPNTEGDQCHTGLTARELIDISNDAVWEPLNGVDAHAALNTTQTPAGSWGAEGVKKTSTSGGATWLPQYTFWEAAVDLTAFTGSGQGCGLLNAMWLSQSSGSGDSSALQDIVGPKKLELVPVDAGIDETFDCTSNNQSYTLDATSSSLSEEELANAQCAWEVECDDNSTPAITDTSCTDVEFDFDESSLTQSVSCDVSVTINPSGTAGVCENSATLEDLKFYPPLRGRAQMTGSCDGTFDYQSAASGGPGETISCAWTFTDPNGTDQPVVNDCATTATTYDDISSDQTGTWLGSLTLTSGDCSITIADRSADVYEPITVSLTPGAKSRTCSTEMPNRDIPTGVTYTADVSGGDGSYTYSWRGCSSSTDECTIQPNTGDTCVSQGLNLTVDDGSTLCPGATSETENYTLQTIINASDN